MKIYCISDNIETAVGLKLSGIETIVLQKKEDIEAEIDKVIEDENIGILIITENINKLVQDKLLYIKENLRFPLLVNI